MTRAQSRPFRQPQQQTTFPAQGGRLTCSSTSLSEDGSRGLQCGSRSRPSTPIKYLATSRQGCLVLFFVIRRRIRHTVLLGDNPSQIQISSANPCGGRRGSKTPLMRSKEKFATVFRDSATHHINRKWVIASVQMKLCCTHSNKR